MDQEKLAVLKGKLKRMREDALQKNIIKKENKRMQKIQANKIKKIKLQENQGKQNKCILEKTKNVKDQDDNVIIESKVFGKREKCDVTKEISQTNSEPNLETDKRNKTRQTQTRSHSPSNNDITLEDNSRKNETSKRKKKKSSQRKKYEIDEFTKQKRENTKRRVQKLRAKMTEEQLENKRKKDRERYRVKKEQGLVKGIKDLPAKKQKKQRKEWQNNSLKYRKRQKLKKATHQFLTLNSPPSTDNEENDEIPDNLNILPSNQSSRQENLLSTVNNNQSNNENNFTKMKLIKKNKGRQKVKKDRSACYRKLKAAEQKIAILEKSLRKYKKQMQRQKVKNQNTTRITESDSPDTKINKLTVNMELTPTVKRTLLFGEVIKKQLVENSKQLSSKKDKNILSKVISGRILKHYKMVGDIKKVVSYKMHSKQINNLNLSQYERKKRNGAVIERIRKSIEDFLENDENSKMCPGKKDFVVKGKLKKQKRLLLDSIKNLHKKYLQTSHPYRVSLTTFWRNRPFWIVAPKQSDRETCACIKHANMELLVFEMYKLNLIEISRPDSLMQTLICDEGTLECSLRSCPNCKYKVCKIIPQQALNGSSVIFQQWESKAETKNIKGVTKIIRQTTKAERKATVEQLAKYLNDQAVVYLKHLYFMKHQQRELQNQKRNIGVNEILIQIDFSENYIAKCHSEIQSMHFGASKKQISLHTGIYYYRETYESSVKSQTFCSVSNNLDHQAHAIWAHLDEILLQLARSFPDTTRLIFASDGPTSQYKNRNNCYLLLKKIPTYFKNLKDLAWNFSESGHGKGPMDGVGGSLKRDADKLVLRGSDITCAKDFVQKLKTSAVKIWEVSSQKIEVVKKELPKAVTQVPNIMSVRQITWTKKADNKLFLRSLSCYSCDFDKSCVHYSLKTPSVSVALEKQSILLLFRL